MQVSESASQRVSEALIGGSEAGAEDYQSHDGHMTWWR